MWNEIAVVVSSLGVGGLLGAFGKAVFDKRHLKFSKVFEYKERRYQALAILMWVAMNPTDDEFEKLRARRPELVDVRQLDRELDLEYHNAMLFASKRVLRELDSFRAEKNAAAWKAVMRAMKRDLYS